VYSKRISNPQCLGNRISKRINKQLIQA
jgi:hypothetical protein